MSDGLAPVVVADHQWRGRWVAADELEPAGEVLRVRGAVVPGLRDHHVHLGLVDAAALGRSVLSAVDDLGWSPAAALAFRTQAPGGCRVRVAGPFLTAPGGYPAGRSWAPHDSVVELSSAEVAAATVRALVTAGVDLIKVALHTGMPLLGDAELDAVVATAHAAGRSVVAHVEGRGQSARAAAAGVDALAHVPFSESLSDALVGEMVEAETTWISTLALHGSGRASRVPRDNVRRFVAAGGHVRYGTDLGNGPGPVDLRIDEITALAAAGLDLMTIMDSIAVVRAESGPVTWTPEPPPRASAELPEWFATLRRVPVTELERSR